MKLLAGFRVGTVKKRRVLILDVSSQKNMMNSCLNKPNCFTSICRLISDYENGL